MAVASQFMPRAFSREGGREGLDRRCRPAWCVLATIIAITLSSFLGGTARPEEGGAEGASGSRTPLEEGGAEDASGSAVPLYEQPPYDLIFLDAANDNAVLKVSPLPFPDRKAPSPLPKSGFLELELFDRPGERFRAAWPQIVRIQLFEEILVEKAQKLIEQGDFAAAWDYLEFLHAEYPKVEGLDALRQRFWFEEAVARIKAGQFDRAYGDLRNLWAENPEYPGLKDAIGQAADGLVDQYWQRSEYVAARQIVDGLAEFAPDHPVVARRRQQFQAEAQSLLAETEAALQQGDFRKADQTARRMMAIWPDLPGAADCLRRVQTAYPRLRVGVTLAAGDWQPASLTDWAARRSGRLLTRCWAEWVGIGPEGGIYATPFHTMQAEELGRRLVFQLTAKGSAPAAPTVADLTAFLWSLGDSRAHPFSPLWADLVQELSVRTGGAVIAQLRRPHVRPEVFLRYPVECLSSMRGESEETGTGTAIRLAASPSAAHDHAPGLQIEGGSGPRNLPNLMGPYVLDSAAGSGSSPMAVYVANRVHGDPPPGRPAEVAEVAFARGQDALAALRRGELDVVDRVNPWERSLVEGQADLELRKYAAPLVHMLIPNFSRPLPESRDFRRAILLGTDRERVLRMLLDGRSEEGCRVISGPFPAGSRRADPLGYAYDEAIEPRTYQPASALTLLQVAAAQVRDAARKQGRPAPEGNLVILRLPPHEMARAACQEMARQWRLLGLEVRLSEALPNDGLQPSEDWDFLYAEVAMWEPCGDVFRLFSLPIFQGQFSPYVMLSLARVTEAADWPEMSARLRAVHRAVHDDLAILPLYQLVDYFVVRKGIEGMPPRPAVLYQEIEKWQVLPKQ